VYSIPFALALWVAATSVHADVLTREAVVATVLAEHPEVIASEQAWKAARGRHLQSRILSDPEVEIEFEELPGVFDTGQFGERNVSVSQAIENPLKWFYRNKSSGYEVERVQLSVYEMTRLKMVSRAKIAYDRVLADQMILASARGNLELSCTLMNRARIRLEAGDVPKLEVLRAQVEESRAQGQANQAERRLAKSQAELNALIGRAADFNAELSGDLTVEAKVLDLGVLRQKAGSRPDVRAAERSVSAERAARSSVLAGWVPDMNLGVGRQTIDGGQTRSSFWKVSFGFSVPLWAPFRQRGELAEGNANRARAEAELAAARRSAELEVEEAFRAYQAGQDQVRLYEERILTLAEETLRVAEQSYSQGKASYLDLLDAQQTLMASRIEHIEALVAFRTVVTELEFATGTALEKSEAIK
jgi:cobalt-zinc-cadmium efflux system outer membrane protein